MTAPQLPLQSPNLNQVYAPMLIGFVLSGVIWKAVSHPVSLLIALVSITVAIFLQFIRVHPRKVTPLKNFFAVLGGALLAPVVLDRLFG